jgi:hypothetical protein
VGAVQRWVEHFDELLNAHEVELQESTIVNETREDTATIEETEIAIEKLKNNKAPGIDIIQATLKRRSTPTRLHCAISKNAFIFTLVAMRT